MQLYTMFSYSILITSFSSPELVIFMQALEHLFEAVGLYIRSPVYWMMYQYGTPISIVPAPSGAIVVFGVKVTVSAFYDVEFPSRLELDES